MREQLKVDRQLLMKTHLSGSRLLARVMYEGRRGEACKMGVKQKQRIRNKETTKCR